MPRSTKGVKRNEVDGGALKSALDAIHDEDETKRISKRGAAKMFKVSRSTLDRHCEEYLQNPGSFVYAVNYCTKQVFSKEEEVALVQYVTTVAQMNYGLNLRGLRLLSYKYAVANRKKYPPKWDEEQIAGEEWCRLFVKRFSKELSLRKPEPTSMSRATAFNRHNVGVFFINLKTVHTKHGPFPPERTWNIDEKGLKTVQQQVARVLAAKGSKQVGGVTAAERGQLVTMIGAISAIGNTVPPLLVFPRVKAKDFMLHGAPPGSICAGTPSATGWSTEETFYQFLVHFVRFISCSKENRALLIMDNHETHLSVKSVEFAYDSGLALLTFPPHTSHRLQPLDVGVYGPLQHYYDQALDSWLYSNPGKPFNIYKIAETLGIAYPRAFTPQNIQSGFRKSGIYPLDPEIFTDADFLSSAVTDRPMEDSTNEVAASVNELEEHSESIDHPTAGASTIVQPSQSAPSIALTNSSKMPTAQPVASAKSSKSSSAQLVAPVNSSKPRAAQAVTPGKTASTSATLPVTPENSSQTSNTPSVTSENSAGTPTNSLVTPEDSLKKRVSVSPEEVMPYPKAEKRKKLNRGKQPGRSMIPTDTPEKIALRKAQEERDRKKAEQEKRKADREEKKAKQQEMKAQKKSAHPDNIKKNLSKTFENSMTTKKTISRKRRAVTVVETSSSDSDDDPVVLAETSDEEDDEECLYCSNSRASDRSGEKWCKCLTCGRWAHYLCADVSGSQWKTYVCDLCL